MSDFRWPVIVVTAVVALGLFFGISHFRQRYLTEEPFLESLRQMEEISAAYLDREGGKEILVFVPSPSFDGALPDLVAEINNRAAGYFRQPPLMTVKDNRNQRLELFARAVSPALYEGVRLGNYRAVAESIYEKAEDYSLEEVLFAADRRGLYLQARDGDHSLYLIIPLHEPERGA